MIQLPVKGQGTFVFKIDTVLHALSIRGAENFITATFTESNVEMITETKPLVDLSNTKGISKHNGAYYWISLDAQNMILIAGVGEPRMETAIYTYNFPYHAAKKYLETLERIEHSGLTPIRFLRDPITARVPLLIKNTDELTMNDIAAQTYLPKSALSPAAQQLYDSIAGRRFRLDTELIKAIEHSIATPGCWCYKTLKRKASEFGKPNPLETYLRITLGQNNGESPGVPYVMEIWPPGHYSPVHNHGRANAVIRVLHGGIRVKLFPFLCPDVVPFAEADFTKGDVTWISAGLNQVHQLVNVGTKTCVTIQCYMYDSNNTEHYDYFDYIGDKIEQYEPDSDMDFLQFEALMFEEWSARKCCSICNIL